ncbi:MAG: putative toxin-antitoxin system toxin component, PIN family [Dehalococcoidia bacterium]
MRPTPRICLDANSMISGIASPNGASGRIVRNIASGRIQLVVSPDIIDEYVTIGQRPSVIRLFARHGVSVIEYLDVLHELCATAEVVVPEGDPPACRDENDRKYLHCAVSAHVDFLVSRDDDLLHLERVESIPILDPGAFLTELRRLNEALDP